MRNELLKTMAAIWDDAENINSYYRYHGRINKLQSLELIELNAKADMVADLLSVNWTLEDYERRELEDIRRNVEYARLVAFYN